MVERVDAGDILKQGHFPLAADETSLTINAKAYNAAIQTFAEIIDDLATGQATPQPIPNSLLTAEIAANGNAGRWIYDASLLNAGDIQRMAGHFHSITTFNVEPQYDNLSMVS